LVRLDRSVGAAFDAVNQDLTEGVYGVRVIKAFALEGERIRRFTNAVRVFAERARHALAYASRHIPLPQIIVALGQVCVLVVGARLVHTGRLDIGNLVASLLLMNTVIFRVETIGRVMQVFADARSSAARIMEVLDAEPKIEGGRGHVPEGPLGVELRSVRVRAPGGETDVLDHCSLSIAPGEVVALVGATGSGKSTLTGLLPRLVDPDEGQVLFGSDEGGWRDVKGLDLAELRRRVHVVPQDVFLFSDTVDANLRLGARDASEADVKRALKLACAEEIVAGLPPGTCHRDRRPGRDFVRGPAPAFDLGPRFRGPARAAGARRRDQRARRGHRTCNPRRVAGHWLGRRTAADPAAGGK
jgi:ATP-binding cassette subfamily B protein